MADGVGLEAIIYAVGTALIVMLMVKDTHVHFYRTAATTDSLTGLFNRGAFLEAAKNMCARQECARRTGDVVDVRSRSFQIGQ